MTEFERDRAEVAREIADMERQMDRLPRTHRAWYPLAHARKEWGHGLPETLAVAKRDVARARAYLEEEGAEAPMEAR